MTPNDIQALIEGIIALAETDGNISEDELKIIDQVKIDGEKYVTIFNEILEKQIITRNDLEKLERAKIRILENATNVAGEDAIITTDERTILLKILEMINKASN